MKARPRGSAVQGSNRGAFTILLLFIYYFNRVACLPFSTLVGGDKADKCMKRGGGKRPFFFGVCPAVDPLINQNLKSDPRFCVVTFSCIYVALTRLLS